MSSPPSNLQSDSFITGGIIPSSSWSMNVDLNLCYDDTPQFRHCLDDVEKFINESMEITGKSFVKQIQKALDLTKGK